MSFYSLKMKLLYFKKSFVLLITVINMKIRQVEEDNYANCTVQ